MKTQFISPLKEGVFLSGNDKKKSNLNTSFQKYLCIYNRNNKKRIGFKMEMQEKIMATLAILLTVGYGITMAESGVSIPGCSEGTP